MSWRKPLTDGQSYALFLCVALVVVALSARAAEWYAGEVIEARRKAGLCVCEGTR